MNAGWNKRDQQGRHLPRVALLLLALLLPPASLLAQQQPRPLFVQPFDGGAGGPAATNRLRQLLRRTGPFSLATVPAGSPVAGGTLGEGFLKGRLQAADGRGLFEKKYARGGSELDLRQFADDIVFTLTKRPGITTGQIAFAFGRAGQSPQIYLCDFDGGNIRQITEGGTNVASAISPDGTSLAHVALQKGNLGILRVVDLVSGKPLKIHTEPASRIEPAFSPDGKRIALSMSTDGSANSDLFLLKLPRGKPAPLTRTPVPESSPSWAPDGKRLVFAAPPAPGRSDLFILDIRNKTSTPLVTGYPVSIDPSWSPDGNLIAFVEVRGDQRTLCIRNLTTGRTRRLTSGSEPFWGADSRHLLFTTSAGLSMIQVDTGRIFPVVAGRVVGASWTR